MIPGLLCKGAAALIFSAAMAYIVFDRDETERLQEGGTRRYVTYISGLLLPTYVLTIAVLAFATLDARAAVRLTLSFCFGVFLHICLYYLLLLPLLPLLRRHISARACAMLWMLPNYLYITQMSWMSLPQPRWVIQAPSLLVRVLLVLWLAGFLAVLGWNIASHLVFRAQILRDAVPAADPAVLEVWKREVEAARFRRPKFKLVVSPGVRTPLSVGLFQRSVRVVLPDRRYSPEELPLIFRHELVHIGREDAWGKFSMVFCTAMCWFNPLMWTAMKKSSEDLELSCDETVLLDAGGDLKRKYADLLLKTAGDDRGFTTCLSASANTLRYRLKSVVEPRKKRSGALAIGLIFFLLCMSCGYVALAYGEDTGAELIYQSQPWEQFTPNHIRWNDDPYSPVRFCTDKAALHRFFSTLRMEHIVGNYFFDTEGKSLHMWLDSPEGTLYLTLSDRFLALAPSGVKTETYYLPDGVDWDTLDACITEYPAMNVQLIGTEDGFSEEFPASLWQVSLAEGDGAGVLYEHSLEETPGGLFGCPSADYAALSFNLPLRGACTVKVVPMRGGGSSYTVTLAGPSLTLPLSDPAARYIVQGQFQGRDGTLYQAEFRFAIED